MTQQRSVLHPEYLLGSWIPLYASRVIDTIVAVVLGAGGLVEWIGPLKAVFPLVFLVLTALLCTSGPLALVAVLGGVMSIAFAMYLPSGWNIVSAGLIASLAGIPLERLLCRSVRA